MKLAEQKTHLGGQIVYSPDQRFEKTAYSVYVFVSVFAKKFSNI